MIAETYHLQVPVRFTGVDNPVMVDEKLSHLLIVLQSMGVKTLYSCQGGPRKGYHIEEHFKYMGYISMKEDEASRKFVDILIANRRRSTSGNGQNHLSIEYSYWPDHGHRVCVRFLPEDIESIYKLFLDYLW